MAKEEVALPIILKRLGRLIDQRIDQMLKEHSIARSQYRVLYYVNLFKEPAQKDLVDIMEIQASTLTSIIDVLAQKGWLLRIKDNSDKRLNRVRLSKEGQKQFEQIPEPSKKLQKEILKVLSKEQARELGILLTKVIKELK